MKKQRGFVEIVFGAVVLCAFLLLGFVISSYECGAKWERSGMNTTWGPVQGCLVQTASGRWIPEERVREIDLDSREGKRLANEEDK